MRTKFLIALAIMTLTGSTAWAGASRVLDGAQITNSGALLTLPTTTDTILGRATTDTLTNKSISGSTNTFSSIPVSAIATGTGLSVTSGGTGAATLTSNGMIYGNGTSAVGITSAGTQYQSFQAGASGVPTVGAIHLDQSAAITGTLGVGNGGTGLANPTSGSVLIGNGSSALSQVAAGTSGNVLTSNGSTWVSMAASSGAPSLNGGSAAAQSVTVSGGVSLSSIGFYNFAWLIGSPGAVTVTATPSVTAGTADGQLLRLVGTDATKVVTLQDQANLAGSGLSLNGNWAGGKDSVLTLHWDAGQSLWIEDSRR